MAKWALVLLASAWIILGLVWGGLHFLIVPRIGELRPWVQEQASQRLGITVRIGSIQARSNGLIPSLEFTEVSLHDAQDQVALRLPTIMAALSPRSLLGFGFEQVYVEGLELDVHRSTDGRIWVAGFAIPDAPGQDHAATDWLFAQGELALRHGTVRWTDMMRGAPTLELHDVDVVLRNRHRRHALRVDATPPDALGARLTVQGLFREPLLSRGHIAWQQWDGQLFANLDQIDLARLRQYVDMGFDLTGSGAMRAWLDVRKGDLVAATADVAMQDLRLQVDPALQRLELTQLRGRLGATRIDGGYEVFTQQLQFDTQDGLRWPGGNFKARVLQAQGARPQRAELTAQQLDLQAMAQIADALPFPPASRNLLHELAPKGQLVHFKGSWQGKSDQAEHFAAQGRLERFSIATPTGAQHHWPGVQGADLDFDVDQNGGRVDVDLRNGALDFPQIFDEPHIPLDRLQGQVLWKVQGENIEVNVPRLQLASADAQGELQAKWRTAKVPAGSIDAAVLAQRFPGVLDLQGTLVRAQGNRVHRYLPSSLSHEVRAYVREAVVSAEASDVRFKVKGDLAEFPFAASKPGEFRIAAQIGGANFAYVPSSLLGKDSLPWPALVGLNGELLIDRDVLKVKVSKATPFNAPGVLLGKAEGVIKNLYQGAYLTVTAEGRGPLPEMLGFVNASPLDALLGNVLSRSTASGNADLRFKLGLPLADPGATVVSGAVTLTGNDLQIVPESPRLTRATGVVGFSHTGFTVTSGRARALGGDVQLEGGMTLQPAAAGPRVLRMQGSASAEGLRQAGELGFVAQLARHATGAARYDATLGLRDGLTALEINSTLQGMAVTLPAPFTKSADAALPLRVENSAIRVLDSNGAPVAPGHQDQWQVEVGKQTHVVYQRDVSTARPKVIRGSIAVGLAADESSPLPAQGVQANVSLPALDLDAWSEVLDQLSEGEGSGDGASAWEYVPNHMALRTRSLQFGARRLNEVTAGVSRDALMWRANAQAAEGSGYVEFRQSSPGNAGRVYARMSRLALGPATARDVESLLVDQPVSIPALDIVVDDFELRGKRLGKLEIDAVNMGAGATREGLREWRLNHFNIITPEATLTASGNWSANAQARPGERDRRRTALALRLDILDSGALLNRFGMPGVVRNGRGKVEGSMDWQGSPITLDYASLSGKLNVNVEAGQFLKADAGIAKLLGVLSLQSLPRRLTLDFRDVFSEGFAFDYLRGDVAIAQGIARTENLQMKGVNAAVFMDGLTDIAKETQQIKVVVVPEINAGSASLLASIANPLVGLSTFLAQLVLRLPLMDAATREFHIDGTWVEPRISPVDRNQNKPAPKEAS